MYNSRMTSEFNAGDVACMSSYPCVCAGGTCGTPYPGYFLKGDAAGSDCAGGGNGGAAISGPYLG